MTSGDRWRSWVRVKLRDINEVHLADHDDVGGQLCMEEEGGDEGLAGLKELLRVDSNVMTEYSCLEIFPATSHPLELYVL